MTIDELCAVIRKRRQETGLRWRITASGAIRECTGHCPLTGGCRHETEIEYEPDDYEQAAQEMGFDDDPELVANAADNLGTYDDAVSAIRAKLEAACLGPLE